MSKKRSIISVEWNQSKEPERPENRFSGTVRKGMRTMGAVIWGAFVLLVTVVLERESFFS